MIGDAVRTGFGRRSADPNPEVKVGLPAPEEHAGDNRRATRRARTLLSGKIILAEGLISPDCVIRDLSPGGARVRISGAIDLPTTVSLLVIKEGLLFDAIIAWRRGDETGLSFTDRHDLHGDSDPSRKGVRALWSELAPR